MKNVKWVALFIAIFYPLRALLCWLVLGAGGIWSLSAITAFDRTYAEALSAADAYAFWNDSSQQFFFKLLVATAVIGFVSLLIVYVWKEKTEKQEKAGFAWMMTIAAIICGALLLKMFESVLWIVVAVVALLLIGRIGGSVGRVAVKVIDSLPEDPDRVAMGSYGYSVDGTDVYVITKSGRRGVIHCDSIQEMRSLTARLQSEEDVYF